MKNDNWHSKTLQELENKDWGEANEWDTNMVKECHRLRRVPINQFDINEYRMMIGQEIGLPYLLPLALEILRTNPLVESWYTGDLLNTVLGVPTIFWDQSPELKEQLEEIKSLAIIAIGKMEVEEANDLTDRIKALKSGKG